MPESPAEVQHDPNHIIAERRAKLRALREQGKAFPNHFERSDLTAELKRNHAEKTREELEAAGIKARIAGRLMLKRVMGKASFGTLQDMSGRIQVFVNNDDTGETAHAAFKQLDLG